MTHADRYKGAVDKKNVIRTLRRFVVAHSSLWQERDSGVQAGVLGLDLKAMGAWRREVKGRSEYDLQCLPEGEISSILFFYNGVFLGVCVCALRRSRWMIELHYIWREQLLLHSKLGHAFIVRLSSTHIVCERDAVG